MHKGAVASANGFIAVVLSTRMPLFALLNSLSFKVRLFGFFCMVFCVMIDLLLASNCFGNQKTIWDV
jgi:hypothetical protein